MSSPRSNSASGAVVVAIALLALFAGIAVASGTDVLRFLPILSLVLAGLVALIYVTRYNTTVQRPTVHQSSDTGIHR